MCCILSSNLYLYLSVKPMQTNILQKIYYIVCPAAAAECVLLLCSKLLAGAGQPLLVCLFTELGGTNHMANNHTTTNSSCNQDTQDKVENCYLHFVYNCLKVGGTPSVFCFLQEYYWMHA